MPVIKSAESLILSEEPVRGSHWEFEILDSPVGAMPKDLEVTIRSIPDLTASLAAPTTSCINSDVAFPGGRENVCGSIGIHMYTGNTMLRWWWSWWNRIWNRGEIGLYGDIVGQGVVRFLDVEFGVVNTFKLTDVWPSKISVRPRDQEDDGDPVLYEIELQIAEVDLVSQ